MRTASTSQKDIVMTGARVVATAGLLTVGLLHGAWAAGTSWPAPSARALADAVVGAPSPPARVPTVVVAAGLTGAAVLIAGGAGRPRWVRACLRALAAVLVARAVMDGAVVAEALTGRHPSAVFRRLDRVLYRPLCLVLGVAVFVGR